MVVQKTSMTTVATMTIEGTGSNSMPADKMESPADQEEEKPVKHESSKDHEQEKLMLNGDSYVNSKVQALDGGKVISKMKTTQTFGKMMNAYCDQQYIVDPATMAFLFEGRRLQADQTPSELEMEYGDTVDAVLHFSGGGPFYQST